MVMRNQINYSSHAMCTRLRSVDRWFIPNSKLKAQVAWLKDVQAKREQGSQKKVSKDVALATAKSGHMSLGCSFPVGLNRLPVVGGHPLGSLI